MAVPRGQRYPSLNKYLKYTMAPFSSNPVIDMFLCLGNGFASLSALLCLLQFAENFKTKSVGHLDLKWTHENQCA